MIPIILGTDIATDRQICLSPEIFERHFHLIGATGSGKTTAILTMIRPILMDPIDRACIFIVDPMGNLSKDLLRWMANKRYCPEHVRKRLLYIEPAREEIVLPFNPLLYQTPAHEYYQVERAVSIILRAWESQELAAMPRLRKWTFSSFTAAARRGHPIASCQYLLQPGSDEHNALLGQLPEDLQYEWKEILSARGNEAIRILESTRNRLDPFFRSVILRRMFGSRRNHFDVQRFIRERRIVILNLAGYGRVPRHLGSTIGGLAVNEILEGAAHLAGESPNLVRPTYILLDEFQNFGGPDIYDAIPTVRQQGVRLILSHQSFSQLEQGDIDLSGLIWQARSRLVFACDADDADRLAHEVAHLTFNAYEIKNMLKSYKQRIAGYRREWLQTRGSTEGSTEGFQEQHGTKRSAGAGRITPPDSYESTRTATSGTDMTDSQTRSGGTTQQESRGEHEINIPIHEDFEEVSNITFKSFEERRSEWGRDIRKLGTGQALGKFADDPQLYRVQVHHDPIPDSPQIRAEMQNLIEQNFQSDLFVSAADLDREAEELRQALFHDPPVTLHVERSETPALPGPVVPVHTPAPSKQAKPPDPLFP